MKRDYSRSEITDLIAYSTTGEVVRSKNPLQELANILNERHWKGRKIRTVPDLRAVAEELSEKSIDEFLKLQEEGFYNQK
jgi:hypothetical protein